MSLHRPQQALFLLSLCQSFGVKHLCNSCSIYLGLPSTIALRPFKRNHHQSSTVPKLQMACTALLIHSSASDVLPRVQNEQQMGQHGRHKEAAHVQKFRSSQLSSSFTHRFCSLCIVSTHGVPKLIASLSSCQDTTL